jgi:hypothetical protein
MLQYRTGGLQNIEQDDGRILYEKTAKFWDTIEGLQNIGEDEDKYWTGGRRNIVHTRDKKEDGRILGRRIPKYCTRRRQNVGHDKGRILNNRMIEYWI